MLTDENKYYFESVISDLKKIEYVQHYYDDIFYQLYLFSFSHISPIPILSLDYIID